MGSFQMDRLRNVGLQSNVRIDGWKKDNKRKPREIYGNTMLKKVSDAKN